jgi:hypothetical protein
MARPLCNIAAVIIMMAVVFVASTLIPNFGPQWGIDPATVVLFLIALGAVHWLHEKMKERLGDDEIKRYRMLPEWP